MGRRYLETSLSPDGSKVAVSVEDGPLGALDIWIFDIERDVKMRFTFNADDDERPVWSPDGRRIAYASTYGGVMAVYVKSIGGAAEEKLLYEHGGEDAYPATWSPDGRFLVVEGTEGIDDYDLWLLPLDGESEARSLIATEFLDKWAEISPDGRWMAYASDESGELEVYVTTFPEVGRRWQISSGGGNHPLWNEDGRRLWFLRDETLVEAEVDGSGSTFYVGLIEELFETRLRPSRGRAHSITGDGERVLVNTLTDVSLGSSQPLTLVTNISTELLDR